MAIFLLLYRQIVHVTGKYHRCEVAASSGEWSSDIVFFVICTPVESKPVTDVRHHPSPRASEFKAIHASDMKFIEVEKIPSECAVRRLKKVLIDL